MPEPVILPTTVGTLDQELLDEISKDYQRLQMQKARTSGQSNVEVRVLRNLAFFYGEHYLNEGPQQLMVPTNDENKLYLVFNVLAQRAEKFMGRVSSGALNGSFKAQPNKRDPKAIATAEVVDRMMIALDQKLSQPSVTWEILHWLTYGGVAFEMTTWQPNQSHEPMPVQNEAGEYMFRHVPSGPEAILTQSDVDAMIASGEAQEHFELVQETVPVGEVSSKVYGPLNVFVDASTKSIDKLPPDGAIYVAEPQTKGWVVENFGYNEDGSPNMEMLAEIEEAGPDKNIRIVTTTLNQLGPAHGACDLHDMIPTVQGSLDSDDPDVFVVVHRFQPSGFKYPEGRYTVFVPGKMILRDGPNPYGEIPIVDFHLKPVTTTFWSKDYVSDLIAPQKYLNKRLSQFGEHTNANVYGKMLLGPGLKRQDITPDAPEAIENGLDDQGNERIKRMGVGELPVTAIDTVKLTLQLLNDLSGGSDLFQEMKFPGQMRGPSAVPMLQEILDSEWGNLYEHLGERFARVRQQRINRVRQFYPAHRTMHYTDRNQRDEVLEFYKDDVFKDGLNFSIRVERGSMVPELRALRESKIVQRLNSPLGVMYVDERTGALDKSKIAADLQFGETGRESREAQYRKLQVQLNDKILKGLPVPPVLPFWDHNAMMDELEAAMATTEFLESSPEVQQAYLTRWQEHMGWVQQAADKQNAAMQNQMVQSAVAQATQQAAAQAASQTVDAVMEQLIAQAQTANKVPLSVASGLVQSGVGDGKR